jgi:hypothetical protein
MELGTHEITLLIKIQMRGGEEGALILGNQGQRVCYPAPIPSPMV